MGQTVMGVMLGVEAASIEAKGVELHNDGETGLLERWEREGDKGHKGRGRFRLRHTFEADPEVFGYFVACDHGDENGVDDLDGRAVRLDEFARGKGFVRAQAAWKRFAAWAKTQGVTLPKPALWLVPTEVA